MKVKDTYRLLFGSQANRGREAAYRMRFSACLAASLAVLILAANLPLRGDWGPVGWYVSRPAERISVDFVEDIQQPDEKAGNLITRFEEGDDQDPVGESPFRKDAPDEQKMIDENAGEAVPAAKMSGRKVFDIAQRMPHIVGGIGAYYIHIEYPQDAAEAGIEGRLVLSFIVEPDGRTSDVQVVKTLHPSCDSAAVRALRQTRFVPGRQNGKRVPVRMRLPVRFQLIEPDEVPRLPHTASG